MSAAQDAITPELHTRLERLLGGPVSELAPLVGGHSGITLTCVTSGGERVVVKVAAPGRPAKGRHDVLRQARAMAHVAPYIVVPQVLAVEDSEQPLAVLSFVAGAAVEPAIDDTGAELDRDLVANRFEVATQLLARLHRAPLGLLGAEPATTPQAELDQFRRIAAAGEQEFRGLAERAAESLARAVPSPGPATVVHGDFRLGNVMFQGVEPRAVVDWEIWSVGDPRVDLGWLATFADSDHFPGIARTDVPLPGVASVVEAYSEASGAPVSDASWFLRLGAFRMGAIMAHNLHRHRTGRHVDPYQESLPPTIARLLSLAADD